MSNHPRDTVAHNSQAAVDFLVQLGNECPLLSVKKINIATGKEEGFKTDPFPGFLQQDSVVACARALVEKNQGEGDIYYALNRTEDTGNKKAGRTDVISLDFVHVDLDPRVGEPLDEAKKRLTEQLRNFRLKPTFIIDSGGGVQGIWRIKPEERIQINGDLAIAEDAKLYNIQLERELGGDSCHNIDRIMRLPGTINCPNTTKRKKNPPRQYAPAYVIEHNPDAVVSLADVGKAAATPADAKGTATAAPRAPSSSAPVVAGPRIVNLDDVPESAKLKDWTKRVIYDGEDKLGEKSWKSRSEMVFAVCCEMVRHGVPDDVMATILTDPDFKISKSVLEKKNVAREVERLITRSRAEAEDKVLAEMNQRNADVSVKGKYKVLTFLPDARYPLQRVAEFSSKEDFCNFNVHPKVNAGSADKPLWKGRGQHFLDSPHHEKFDGIDFVPGAEPVIHRVDGTGHTTRHVNLFSGFSVIPREGDCELYLQHVRDNICGGDEVLNDYVLNWMASGVQHPEDPCRTALSIRGKPGTGKGVFACEYGDLYGRHFTHVTDAEQITGRFNAHTAESCFTFVDEAMFSGSKRAAQILKTRISEKTKILERKGIDAFQIPNYSRYIFATNEEHPLLIEGDDRRYCAIYVQDNRTKDRPYFLAIKKQQNGGGRAALLHMLLNRDISGFNPEAIPGNAELFKQKFASAPVGDRVVISLAQDGYLPGAMVDLGGKTKNRPWIARARGDGFLFEEMRRRGGREIAHIDEVHLTDILKAWKFTRHPLGIQTGWAAPPLANLRTAIADKYPGVEWDRDDIKEWGHAPSEKASTPKPKPEPKSDGGQDDIPF